MLLLPRQRLPVRACGGRGYRRASGFSRRFLGAGRKRIGSQGL